MSNTIVVSSTRTITAILPAESGIVARFRNAFYSIDVDSYITHRTRGALPGCPVDANGMPIWQEMIILEAVVPADHAESIFQTVYEAGVYTNAEAGLLFMGKLGKAAFPSEPEDPLLEMKTSLSADNCSQEDAGDADLATKNQEEKTNEG